MLLKKSNTKAMKLTVQSSRVLGKFNGGDYKLIEGQIEGEIALQDDLPGLDKATDRRYHTSFQLYSPERPASGNGTLLLDLPNRSVPCGSYLYNSPLGYPLPVGTNLPGNGFLQARGFMVASIQWELGQGFFPPEFKEGVQTKYVEAAALAAIRDFLFYIKNEAVILEGLSGDLASVIQKIIGVGWSQTGRLLKTLVLHGFHTKDGQLLLDGIHHHAGPVGWLPIFGTGVGPGSSATYVPDASHPDVRGILEEPLTPNDILAALAKKNLPVPKFIFTVTSLDYYILRASLFRTGAVGDVEQEPDNAFRIYDIAGGAHAIIPSPGCAVERGRLDWRPALRAVLVRLRDWVQQGEAPPDHVLMPLAAPDGSLFHAAAPVYLPNARILLPVLDADGNPLGGIRLPGIAVPLGTHGLPNAPVSDFGCFISGSYRPFQVTASERASLHDVRLSLAERYSGPADYLDKLQSAITALIDAGFMLKDETSAMMELAEVEIRDLLH